MQGIPGKAPGLVEDMQLAAGVGRELAGVGRRLAGNTEHWAARNRGRMVAAGPGEGRELLAGADRGQQLEEGHLELLSLQYTPIINTQSTASWFLPGSFLGSLPAANRSL